VKSESKDSGNLAVDCTGAQVSLLCGEYPNLTFRYNRYVVVLPAL